MRHLDIMKNITFPSRLAAYASHAALPPGWSPQVCGAQRRGAQWYKVALVNGSLPARCTPPPVSNGVNTYQAGYWAGIGII